MARILNIKNRAPITNPHIVALIKECVDNTKQMGYSIPTNLRFLECTAKRRAGLACYRDTTIVLSTFIYKEHDSAIKAIVYHEIGHIVAGPLAHHGPAWRSIVNKMSKVTGLKITRCYSDADMPIHAEEKKKDWKYTFKCKGCGAILHYTRAIEFVKTYDQILYNGKPRWTCTKCGKGFELVKNKED